MAQKQRPQAETLYGSPQPNYIGYATAPIISRRDPTSSDTGYPLGQVWVNKIESSSWVLTSVSAGEGVWQSSAAEGLYPVTPYVVGPEGEADYQTIQSAIDAANAAGGGVVVVQPGDYTENLTLYSGINILGLTFADAGGGVNITGIHVPPINGGFVFRNVRLISSTHIFSSAAAGSSHLIIGDAEIIVTNGYTFNLPNWTGKLESFDVNAAVGTNDGYINNTGGSEIAIFECSVGSGTVNPMIVSGSVLGAGANIYCPVQFQTGSTVIFNYSTFNNTVTFSNNSTGTIATSTFSSGNSAAITMSSSGSVSVSTSVINSSANPCIAGAGAGTLTLADVSFLNNSSTAGTLTKSVSGRISTGGLQLVTGTNATMGVSGALSSGSVTVNTTAVTANSRIFLTADTVSGTQGILFVGVITPGVGFTIRSSDNFDTSTVNWLIVNPA